jgi:hypothetical protein
MSPARQSPVTADSSCSRSEMAILDSGALISDG